MNYTQLNEHWNADPNAPEVQLKLHEDAVILQFYLNSFIFDFDDAEQGRLIFKNCHKYSLNSMNDEGYYMGQYRYKCDELPWGEFYRLETNGENDFPKKAVVLNVNPNKRDLKHYIFFLKDNTFEAVAEDYFFETVKP